MFNHKSLYSKSVGANIGLPTQFEMQLRCHMCKGRGVTKKVFVKCRKCDMELCVKQTCFKDYHMKAQL